MQNKKIGIITFHKNIASYGAALQAYATYQFLKKQGYSPEIIDLRSHDKIFYLRSKNHMTISKSRRWSCIKGRIYYYFRNPIKIFRFRNFNKSLKYTSAYYSVDQLFDSPPLLDVYCTGSDQTLNPRLTIAPDAFLLAFTKGKKIAYASSIGEVTIGDQYKYLYKENIPQYKHISVREENTKNVLADYYNAEIEITLDPTMLLPIEHYVQISVTPHIKEDYLLFFSLHPNKSNIRYAERVAKSNGLKLISVGNKINGVNANYITSAGPREWLGLIKNAKHIITDSFHGTVFSLMLNNNFISIVPLNGDNRIGQVLKKFDLEGHIKHVEDDEVYNINETTFDKAEFIKNLDKESNKSIEWFVNAIED